MATDSTILTDAEWARSLVAAKRDDAGPGLVEARRAGEDEACVLLDRAAGNMTAEEAAELLRLFNVDAYRGAPKRWRFVPGFSGGVAKQLISNLPRLNDAVGRLWSGSIEDALDELETITTRRDLPGAGRSFPSMLLYLRDRDRYAALANAIATGLRALTGREFVHANGRAVYLEFCDVAVRVREELGLAPQELDWILAAASRPREAGPGIGDISEAWERRADWRRSEEWEVPRNAALPAIQSAVERFLSGRDDVHAFRHEIDHLSKAAGHWGFRGTGQMFFNMIVKATDSAHVTAALQAALPPPTDDDHCRRKFEAFHEFVAGAQETADDHGAAKPQFGYAPFFLSFFWEAAERETWPIYYPMTRKVLAECGLWDESGSMADRYLRFRDVMARLRGELVTDQWGAESVLFHMAAARPGSPRPRRAARLADAAEVGVRGLSRGRPHLPRRGHHVGRPEPAGEAVPDPHRDLGHGQDEDRNRARPLPRGWVGGVAPRADRGAVRLDRPARADRLREPDHRAVREHAVARPPAARAGRSGVGRTSRSSTR